MNRKTLADTLSSLHAQYDDARDRIEQAREELAALDSESSSLSATLSQMDLDRRALLREVTALELDLAEVRGRLQGQQARLQQAAQERERLEAERAACVERLATVQPALAVGATAGREG